MTVSRMLAAGLAVLLPSGAIAQAPCIQEGVQYVGQEVIAPGYTRHAQDCQTQCSITLYCAFFTWKAEGNATLNQGPGACLKFNDQATLQPALGLPNLTISGLNQCPTPNGTSTIPPLPTLPALPGLPGFPGLINGSNVTLPNVTLPLLPNATALLNCTNMTNGTCIGGEVQHGGFPWWAIVLIAAVIVGVGAAVIYGSCDDKKKKKKKDKKTKSKKEMRQEAVAVAAEAAEVQQLVAAEAPPPVAEPVVAEVAQVAQMVQQQLSGSPMATTQMMGSGTYMQQPMVYNSQGQVVQMPMQVMQQPTTQIQMPLLTGSARQPQFR